MGAEVQCGSVTFLFACKGESEKCSDRTCVERWNCLIDSKRGFKIILTRSLEGLVASPCSALADVFQYPFCHFQTLKV